MWLGMRSLGRRASAHRGTADKGRSVNKYKVSVVRRAVGHFTTDVLAHHKEDAIEQALQRAADTAISESSASYDIEAVHLLEQGSEGQQRALYPAEVCSYSDAPVLLTRLRDLQTRNEELIVFTSGCFDGLHPGHLHLLFRASELGTKLVVAVNSDASVNRLKGGGRPLFPLSRRVEMLRHLPCVSYVVVLEDDTPEILIRWLAPRVLVRGRGGADDPDGVVGADYVAQEGGRVVLIPELGGFSTSADIAQLKALL